MRPVVPDPAGAHRRVIYVLITAVALLCACSVTPSFPDRTAGPFHPKLELGAEAGPRPEIPAPSRPQAPGIPGRSALGPPQGCTDPDPAVVATCLEPISALAVLPGSAAVSLAAERTTGRILRVQRQRPNQEVTTLAVDPAGDGGLTGLTLSPSYSEDELIYAYITTPVDNRVVRIAPGNLPKPVLAGIPRGATGNAGALAVDSRGMLLVATGDAGNPAAAADPGSLAGKVLRIDTFGRPAPGSPAGSKVLVSGLHSPGGLCTDSLTDEFWLTDRVLDHDLLYRIKPGRPLGRAAWNWPAGSGAAGCVVMQGRVQVTFTSGAPLFALGIGPDDTFIGPPLRIPLERYGRISAAALSPNGREMWLGTVNKAGDKRISSDDRVFILPDLIGGGAGQD